MTIEDVAIGAFSKRTGCAIETIRFYEKIGILPRPRRRGRYRLYAADDFTHLVFVRRARELGFTLDEVRALLRLGSAGADACGEVRDLAATHLQMCESGLRTSARWSVRWRTRSDAVMPEPTPPAL